MREKVIDKLEKYTEKGGYDTGVITRDNFINLATEIVKLFAIPDVIDTVCPYCGSKRIGKDHVGCWCRKCKREFGQTGL